MKSRRHAAVGFPWLAMERVCSLATPSGRIAEKRCCEQDCTDYWGRHRHRSRDEQGPRQGRLHRHPDRRSRERRARRSPTEITREGGKAEFHKLDVRSTEAANAVVAAAEKSPWRHRPDCRQRRHRSPRPPRQPRRCEMGPYARRRSQGHLSRRPSGGRRHARAQEGRDRLPLLDHGRRLWMGRACALFRGESRRCRPRPRPRGRIG